jgi:ADP-ribose pyrophosphatase YjhB (NUDIX family)
MLINMLGRFWKILTPNARRWLTRRFQASFTASAAGLVTNEQGQILLLNHVLRPTSGWGMPGGFIEKGEQPEAALRREVREEAGLELRNIRLAKIRTLHRHMEIIFTATGIGEASVKSREITELAWFDLDDMPGDMSLAQQCLIRSILMPTAEIGSSLDANV